MKLDNKTRALVFSVRLGPYLASHALDERFCEIEAEAGAEKVHFLRVGAREFLEQMRQRFDGNPDARVGYDDPAHAVALFDRDRHASRLRVFNRVVDEVADDF